MWQSFFNSKIRENPDMQCKKEWNDKKATTMAIQEAKPNNSLHDM
jgi:hypothetical protein